MNGAPDVHQYLAANIAGRWGRERGRGDVAAEEVRLTDRVTPTANWLNWEDRPKLAAARVAAAALCGLVFVATGGFKEK